MILVDIRRIGILGPQRARPISQLSARGTWTVSAIGSSGRTSFSIRRVSKLTSFVLENSWKTGFSPQLGKIANPMWNYQSVASNRFFPVQKLMV